MDYRKFQIAQTRFTTVFANLAFSLLIHFPASSNRANPLYDGIALRKNQTFARQNGLQMGDKMQEQLRKAVRRHKWATKLKDCALKTEIARDFFKPVMHRHVTPLFS